MMEAERTRTDAPKEAATNSENADGRAAAKQGEKKPSEGLIEESVVERPCAFEGYPYSGFRLLAYLCIMMFTSSVNRCRGPLQFFIEHSPAFIDEQRLSREDKLLLLADAFALSGSTGLLAGLALSIILAPRSSPRTLGLLCVLSAASGLVLVIIAKTKTALTVGLFLLGLTCATTNAVLPVVACFRNPALIFTIICSTDFASVAPLQVLQHMVERYAVDCTVTLCVYVATVYPLLLVLVSVCVPGHPFPVPAAKFFRPFYAAKQLGADMEDKETLHHGDEEAQADASQKRLTSTGEGSQAKTRHQDPKPVDLPQNPPMWDLSLKEQLCFADIYGISFWWFTISMGLEPFGLYCDQGIVLQSNHAVLQRISAWTALGLPLVLPALYHLHLVQIRLRLTNCSLQMTPEGIGLFASIFLAIAGLLLSTQRLLPCAVAVIIGNILQAIAPTAMFIMLTNAYGMKRLSLFQAFEVILLASVGFLTAFLRPWFMEDKKSYASRLHYILLTFAVVSFVSLMCPRCIQHRPPGSHTLHVLAAGIPLAVERSSMVAVFAQAGYVCPDTDIPVKKAPDSATEERRALLAVEEAYVEES